MTFVTKIPGYGSFAWLVDQRIKDVNQLFRVSRMDKGGEN